MINYYPRLREPLLASIASAICFVVALESNLFSDWTNLLLIIVGCISIGASLTTWIDFMTHKAAERIRELKLANVADIERVSMSLKGLTSAQTDLVIRQLSLELIGIPGSGGPQYYIQCPTMNVPLTYAQDFFESSRELEPYLLPVREGAKAGGGDGWVNGIELATALTGSIIKNGYADRSRGPYSAILKEELTTVARNYGVNL